MRRAWTAFEEAAVSSLFFLGHRVGREHRPIGYPSTPGQRPHLCYYGAPGSGKTSAMLYALTQLARRRDAGFCVVDPHGEMYWRLASYLREEDITDRVLYIDINDLDYVATFDPFASGTSAAHIASTVASALLGTLGAGRDASEQPQLKTTTEAGLLHLLELDLPFALAPRLFNPQEKAFTQLVAQANGKSSMFTAIGSLDRVVDRYREFAPAYRRLDNLTRYDHLFCSLSGPGLDFRKLMDEGWIVLVNAQPEALDAETAVLFVRLLVNQFLLAAKRRPKSDDTDPFLLVIDEAPRFLTSDTATILAETRGYGLHLILGMQTLQQAEAENPKTFTAIRACANAEIVLRVDDFEEALYFGRRFFGHRFNPTAVKYEQTQTVAIPRSVPHVAESWATGRQRGHGEGAGRGTVASLAQGTSVPMDQGFFPLEGTAFDQQGASDTENAFSTDSEAESELHGTQEGWHVEYIYQQLRQPTFLSAEEQDRLAARLFMHRDQGAEARFGVVRVNADDAVPIEIPPIPQPVYTREEMVPYLAEAKATQYATLPLPEARKRIDTLVAERLEFLERRVKHTTATDEHVSTKRPRRVRRTTPSADKGSD